MFLNKKEIPYFSAYSGPGITKCVLIIMIAMQRQGKRKKHVWDQTSELGFEPTASPYASFATRP